LGARLKRDPGLPDLDKWKGRLDQRIALTESRDAERAERAKAARETKLAQKRAQQAAKAAAASGDDDKSISEYKRTTPEDQANRRWFFKEMNKVIDAADVIVEVLDININDTVISSSQHSIAPLSQGAVMHSSMSVTVVTQ
jgi:hypothetical protein